MIRSSVLQKKKVENQLIKTEQLTVTKSVQKTEGTVRHLNAVTKAKWPQSDNMTMPCNDKTKLYHLHFNYSSTSEEEVSLLAHKLM